MGRVRQSQAKGGESFTSIDIRTAFLRPVWADTLTARARPTHSGRTITRYRCDVLRSDGKPVASVISTVMTLRGDSVLGR